MSGRSGMTYSQIGPIEAEHNGHYLPSSYTGTEPSELSHKLVNKEIVYLKTVKRIVLIQ